MKDYTVVVTDYEYQDIAQEKAIVAEFGAKLLEYQYKDAKNLMAVTKDADAIIVQYAQITKEIIDNLDHCKMIIKYGIGVNNIDVDAASAKDIYVCNVPDYGIDEVANHSIALLLALSKKLPIVTKSLRGGNWGFGSTVPLHRLAGSTLGLVGLGRIPMDVAHKMKGFGMTILAYDPYISPEAAAQAGVTLTDLDTLYRQSDFISLHCPLTADTTHLIDKAAFAKMKPSAFLINTSRGPIIDQNALLEALETKRIAGAGLDVFEEEPLDAENKLLSMDNVICTPHCAWYSEEAISVLQRKAAEEVVNVLAGNQPFHAVNFAQVTK